MIHECPVNIRIPCNSFLCEVLGVSNFLYPNAYLLLNIHCCKIQIESKIKISIAHWQWDLVYRVHICLSKITTIFVSNKETVEGVQTKAKLLQLRKFSLTAFPVVESVNAVSGRNPELSFFLCVIFYSNVVCVPNNVFSITYINGEMRSLYNSKPRILTSFKATIVFITFVHLIQHN